MLKNYILSTDSIMLQFSSLQILALLNLILGYVMINNIKSLNIILQCIIILTTSYMLHPILFL